MTTYVIVLKSKSGHEFEYRVQAASEDLAVEQTFWKIEQMGYDYFSYKLKSIRIEQ